jgi:L-fuconolactonase
MQNSPSFVIDAHHHYWWYGKRNHKWPDAVGDRLDQTFTPNDLVPQMELVKVDGCILIQSLNDYDETNEFLNIAKDYPHVLGVVGWIPLDNPDQTLKYLECISNRDLLIGIRHLINFEPDSKWLLRPEVIDSIQVIASQNLVFDLVPVNDVQFESVISVASKFPNLSIVLDHLARPPITQESSDIWINQIQRVSQLPNVSIKLSLGLDILMRWKWSTKDIQLFSDQVLTYFGTDRVMAASNWPVCNLATNYFDVWTSIRFLIKDLSLTDQEKILGNNAKKIFSLNKLPTIQ